MRDLGKEGRWEKRGREREERFREEERTLENGRGRSR